MGEDLEVYKTGAERDKMRAFIRDRELKLKWHTLEQVSKKKRTKIIQYQNV